MMHHANHALVKWVNNKQGILKLFRDEVGKYFNLKATAAGNDVKTVMRCRSRAKMGLYKPGDTRMLSTFRMVFRNLFLRVPLGAMFHCAGYEAAAQANPNPNPNRVASFALRASASLWNSSKAASKAGLVTSLTGSMLASTTSAVQASMASAPPPSTSHFSCTDIRVRSIGHPCKICLIK